MKLGCTPNPVCVNSSLSKLKQGVKVESPVNGQQEKLNSLPSVTRRRVGATSRNRLNYNPTKDGNVFDWILLTAEVVRQVRGLERDVIEKAAAESKRLDEAKMEN